MQREAWLGVAVLLTALVVVALTVPAARGPLPFDPHGRAERPLQATR